MSRLAALAASSFLGTAAVELYSSSSRLGYTPRLVFVQR
jgi:hypothetical protein